VAARVDVDDRDRRLGQELVDGKTISNSPGVSLIWRCASFSQVSWTSSPMPFWAKVTLEARAPSRDRRLLVQAGDELLRLRFRAAVLHGWPQAVRNAIAGAGRLRVRRDDLDARR
jgi:hypothetical protein